MVINCKRLKNSPLILKFWEVYDLTQPNEFPEFGCDLELLNDDDAMTLFRHSAIPQNGSCNYTPTDRLVKKVVCHSTLIYRTCTYTSSICIYLFYLQTTSDFIC